MSDDKDNASIWQRATDLASLTGIKPSDPAYGEVLGLALGQVEYEQSTMYSTEQLLDAYRIVNGEQEATLERWNDKDIAVAAAVEREACAKIAENLHSSDRPEDTLANGYSEDDIFELGGDVAAKLIRARGEVKAEARQSQWAGVAPDYDCDCGICAFCNGMVKRLPVTSPVEASPDWFDCPRLFNDGDTVELIHSQEGSELPSGSRGVVMMRNIKKDADYYIVRFGEEILGCISYHLKAVSSPKSVLVGSIEYGINEQGIYRERKFGNEKGLWRFDTKFAEPVAAYLEQHGLNAGNIKKVEHHSGMGAVLYRWAEVTMPFMLDTGVWSTPMTVESDCEIIGNVIGSFCLKMPSLDANGIPVATDVCTRCGGALQNGRVSVCEGCEPDKEIE